MLQRNGIAFQNLSLEEKANAIEMQQKLKDTHYHAAIYLPVIFENDTVLIYPQAEHNDSTLFFVIQNIISRKDLYAPTSTEINAEHVNKDNTDCDYKEMNRYLVCANFKESKDAENFRNVLASNGYPHAGVIFYKDYYRVYATMIYENENELILLNEIKQQYRGTYLLVIE